MFAPTHPDPEERVARYSTVYKPNSEPLDRLVRREGGIQRMRCAVSRGDWGEQVRPEARMGKWARV
jgi:hypothetical protein